jgi:hypothetical protein
MHTLRPATPPRGTQGASSPPARILLRVTGKGETLTATKDARAKAHDSTPRVQAIARDEGLRGIALLSIASPTPSFRKFKSRVFG